MIRLGPHGLALPANNVSVTLTGASTAGQAGTSTSVVAAKTTTAARKISPLGLVNKYELPFPILTGAATTAEAGVVSATVTGGQLSQLGPIGLTHKSRQFSPKQGGQQNVNAEPLGAVIQGQAASPDSSNTTIYIDGVELSGEAGIVANDIAFVETAAIAGVAGTVTTTTDIVANPVGAEISADAGDVAGIGNSSAVGAVVGAEISGDAGTVVPNVDINVTVTGALINAQASEVGIDNDSQVSVTVTGAEINGLGTAPADSGPVVHTNIIGAVILAEAGPVSSQVVNPVITQPPGGFDFMMRFDSFRDKRDLDREKRDTIEKSRKDIESPVDREIAAFMQKDLAIKAREAELKELELLVAETFGSEGIVRARSERVAKAFVRAAVQGNFSAMEALEREMDRLREEEDFLALALVILD